MVVESIGEGEELGEWSGLDIKFRCLDRCAGLAV